MSLCRILNVGPNPNVRRLLEELVQSDEPVLIRHIETGILALDELVNSPGTDLPDLVFVSFRLPVITGLDFVVQMRSHGHLRSIPIMVWGPDILADQIYQMHKAGADCVFLGEFDTFHLDYVRRFLGLQHSAVEDVASTPAPARVTRRVEQMTVAKLKGNAQLGTIFSCAGWASVALWLIAFLGLSNHAVDLLPLPVYTGLIGAGFVLMSSHADKAKARAQRF